MRECKWGSDDGFRSVLSVQIEKKAAGLHLGAKKSTFNGRDGSRAAGSRTPRRGTKLSFPARLLNDGYRQNLTFARFALVRIITPNFVVHCRCLTSVFNLGLPVHLRFVRGLRDHPPLDFTICSIVPNGLQPLAVWPSIRMESPKAMKGVAGLPSRMISMARTSEMQLEPTSA